MVRSSDDDGPAFADRRNGSVEDPRGAAPTDSRIAMVIIGGIVVMFIIGFVLLLIAMASDWT